MSSPFPYSDPQAWQLQIGSIFVDIEVLGVLVTALKTGVKLDKKESSGRSGATISYLGDKLGSFTVEFRAWEGHGGWPILEALCVLARKQRGQPLAVYHPALDAAGIGQMIVEDIDWPTKIEGGFMVAKWTCTEWAPKPPKPKNVTKTPVKFDTPAVYDPKKSPGIPALPKPPSPAAKKPSL